MRITRLTEPLRRLLTDQHCTFCNIRLKHGAELPVCGHCFEELPWTTAITGPAGELSAFYYQKPVDRYLILGKGNAQLDKLAVLGQLITSYFTVNMAQLPQAIIPVPLHPKRLHQRGFNQASELIRATANQLQLPVLQHAASRISHKTDQKLLPEAARQENVRHAFTVSGPIPYQHVAIFDDVITTGATCRELRRTLHRHGIEKVDIWSCATTKQ